MIEFHCCFCLQRTPNWSTSQCTSPLTMYKVVVQIFLNICCLSYAFSSPHGASQYGKKELSIDWKEKSFDFMQMSKSMSLDEATLQFLPQTRNHIPRRVNIDPDAKRDMKQLVLSQGYPCENYTVQTADGYLLGLYRIPSGRNASGYSDNRKVNPKKVVYLQHGLLSSSCDFVMNFANDSLGFILADAGYDVWIGNSRGNTYSLKHVKYTPKDIQFWDFSFDEMAKYDIPAFVNFILNKTSQSSLFYVGHSQGTTMAYALLSQQPEFQEKVKLFVNLAPVTHITHAKSPIVYLSSIPDQVLYDIFGRRDFLPSDYIIQHTVDLLCQDRLTRWVCYDIVFLICGPDVSNMNASRLDVYMNHTPAGASTKDMIHFSQMHREKIFAMYDYGSAEENMKHYNQSSPPKYDVTKVKVPVIAFTADKDWLADPQDVSDLLVSLPNVQHHTVIKEWNHLDFVWGEDAATLCYKPLVEWLSKYSMIH